MFSNIHIVKYYSNLDFPPWIFLNVLQNIENEMKNSIKNKILKGLLPEAPKKAYYTYLLIDIEKFRKNASFILNNSLVPREPTLKQYLFYKNSIFYVGKGINNRKHQHPTKAKKLICGTLPLKQVELKVSKIASLWKKGKSVVLVQLDSTATSYEAHTRENIIIKALNFNNLTNRIRGTSYGNVKFWPHLKIINYGDMMMFQLFWEFLLKPPNEIFASDVILKTKKAVQPKFCTTCKKRIK